MGAKCPYAFINGKRKMASNSFKKALASTTENMFDIKN